MLSYVAQKEGLKLPDPLRQRIAQTSERNLRRALLCFETCKMAQYPFTDDQTVQMTDWELYIQVCQSVALCRPPYRMWQCRCAVALLVQCTQITVEVDSGKTACGVGSLLLACFLMAHSSNRSMLKITVAALHVCRARV